jgi:two-component system, NarL family, nitrate/nitrite response regulator NarL
MRQATTRSVAETEDCSLDSLARSDAANESASPGDDFAPEVPQNWRIYIVAYNRLLRETLGKLLSKRSDLQVVGQSAATPDIVKDLVNTSVDILLLNSGGDLNADLFLARMVRSQAPRVRIMMLGMNDTGREFLQCVRVGIAGYVLRDASSQRVLEAVQTVCQGGAFCDGHLCQLLFNYFEKNTNSLPSSIVRESLGLTQREQELVPLLARGASNKEIADQFCLSEQTVKNHLYRMKQKVGAANRLGIVHLCRSHGLNV